MNRDAAIHRRDQISFGAALRYWLKLGLISFGGPAGQIAIMHEELVERRRWISEQRFLHALNYCMLLPGPEAQQLATYIGWLMHGVRGGIAAGVLFVLPSLLILMALTWVYLTFGHTSIVSGALYGMKPAVTAIVLLAAWRIGSRTLTHPILWGIAALAFTALFFFDVPFPYIVVSAGLIGYATQRLAPGIFAGRTHAHAKSAVDVALIDDAAPSSAQPGFSVFKTVVYALLGLALWAAVEGALFLLFGWHGTLTQMGWFFTKTALLTFGGAYAALPYVQQNAVEHYGWLTPAQMIDGLALGETTPGPLIMIVAFVGFVGAWTQAVFGADAIVWAGIAGAVVATWFTFLPSFVFILVGAPVVEATRGDLKLTATLTAITAAVVGVIANLAAYFAYHTLWPAEFDNFTGAAGFEWPAAAIGIAALIALWRIKLGVVVVIAACALAGWVVSALGST
jgi:chromate transporter